MATPSDYQATPLEPDSDPGGFMFSLGEFQCFLHLPEQFYVKNLLLPQATEQRKWEPLIGSDINLTFSEHDQQ
jgi:hypothetical protein